jgi:hypothetical protein
MSEAINAHKKMAMGITEGNVMKKGGKVAKYAVGGGVLKSSPIKPDTNAGKTKIATMKKGGKSGVGIMIAIGKPMKSAGRGR